MFCFLVFYFGVYILKELSILTYSSLKINRHLGQNWVIHIIQYLIINEAPLIFTSFFAGFASLCLFLFFLYTFGKYRRNLTINEDTLGDAMEVLFSGVTLSARWQPVE